jgi:hypothetical protein
MRARNFVLAVVTAGLLAACVDESPIRVVAPPPPPPPPPPVTALTVSAPVIPQAPPLDLNVAPDIEARLNKFAPIVLDFDDSKVAPEDRAVIKKAVEAAALMQEIFIQQVDPLGPDYHAALRTDATNAYAAMYFDIMGSRWDELDHDTPFVGSQKRPPGANFYPQDMTKDEFEKFVADHPDKKEAFQSYFTVIKRKDGQLTAVPYSEAYKDQLQQAAVKLREAAAAAKDPTLKNFLVLRAAAILTNDYAESDKAWMDVKGPIEITIGPYETYVDQLFQYKASFEAFVALRDQEESKRLEVIGSKMAELEKNLPLDEKYKKDAASRAKGSPIDVVHLLCNAGTSGVQTVAYNLPNDERVRKEKGSKKVMLKNVLEGKFEYMVKPIAAKVIAEDQVKMLNAEAVFAYILQHEVAHGLGPGFITLKNGTKSEVNKELKELYGGIEEAKADITGLVDAQYLIDKGIYPKKLDKEIYVAFLATAFRQMRFGVKEAHGKGIVSSVNYLMKKGGIVYDKKAERFKIDFAKIKKAVRELSKEYLTIEAEGNYEGAKAFFEKYAVVSPELEKAIATIGTGIPVDITPQFTVYKKSTAW